MKAQKIDRNSVKFARPDSDSNKMKRAVAKISKQRVLAQLLTVKQAITINRELEEEENES